MEIYGATFILISIIQWILDQNIRVKLDYGYERKMSETDGFKPYVWTLCILAAAAIISFFYVDEIHPLISVILIAMFGVRAAFEWKYLRVTKRHVISLIMVAISLVITILFFILWKLYYQ